MKEATTVFMSDSYFLWDPLSSGKGAGKLSTVPRRLCESCVFML